MATRRSDTLPSPTQLALTATSRRQHRDRFARRFRLQLLRRPQRPVPPLITPSGPPRRDQITNRITARTTAMTRAAMAIERVSTGASTGIGDRQANALGSGSMAPTPSRRFATHCVGPPSSAPLPASSRAWPLAKSGVTVSNVQDPHPAASKAVRGGGCATAPRGRGTPSSGRARASFRRLGDSTHQRLGGCPRQPIYPAACPVLGLIAGDLLARPRGFEPLTFGSVVRHLQAFSTW